MKFYFFVFQKFSLFFHYLSNISKNLKNIRKKLDENYNSILDTQDKLSINYISKLNNEERQLKLLITKFAYYFNLSKNNYEPHHLADYLYTLCQSFNAFYTKNKIFSDDISDEEKATRIQIVKDFYNTSCLVSDCLGIKLVDSM